MNYYQSSITKKIIPENFLKSIDYIYGSGRLESLVEDGILKKIKHPTVEECIYYGSTRVAYIRYQEIHKVDWGEAVKEVNKLRKQMFRASQKDWTPEEDEEEQDSPEFEEDEEE